MCQRCGKACDNRTDGRRVRMAGQDLFFCNVCWLHSVTGSEGDNREWIQGVPKAAPQTEK
jgi:hypothetical protein